MSGGSYDHPYANEPDLCMHGVPFAETCERCFLIGYPERPDGTQSPDQWTGMDEVGDER